MLVRHLKRGTTYVVVGTDAKLQIEGQHDMCTLVMYMEVGNDNHTTVWARPLEDFIDGRFVELKNV
jgi:hypothetical protein